MNANEFVEEVLASDICPDNFEDVYKRFQNYQKHALETLKEFHRLCESNEIRYQLAYGSLIGAIRDKGQIPWDYDVDVFVPYEDKSKLINALKTDLHPEFYAYCPEIDPKCDHTLMRISPAGFHSDAIHVDVFYIMALSNDAIEQKEMLQDIDRLFHARSVKKTHVLRDARGSKRRILKLIKEKIDYITLSQKAAETEYDHRCGLYRLEETNYCAPATFDGEKCVYLTSDLWDTELIDLPIGSFRITKDYDRTLRQYYGDYMTVPALDARLNEMKNSLSKIDYYVQHKY